MYIILLVLEYIKHSLSNRSQRSKSPSFFEYMSFNYSKKKGKRKKKGKKEEKLFIFQRRARRSVKTRVSEGIAQISWDYRVILGGVDRSTLGPGSCPHPAGS